MRLQTVQLSFRKERVACVQERPKAFTVSPRQFVLFERFFNTFRDDRYGVGPKLCQRIVCGETLRWIRWKKSFQRLSRSGSLGNILCGIVHAPCENETSSAKTPDR